MSCNVPSLSFAELSSDPVSPSTGRLKLYAKSDGLYTKDDAGNVLPVAIGAAVDSISTLSPIAADQFLYTNGVNQFNVSPITLLGRQLLDDPDAATMRSTLGLVIGTDVQDWSADLDSFVTNASWTGANLSLGGDLTISGALSVPAAGASIDGNLDVLTGNISIQGVSVIAGNGSPESAVTANPGSLFLRGDSVADNTLYVKESGVGNTGWRRVATLAP